MRRTIERLPQFGKRILPSAASSQIRLRDALRYCFNRPVSNNQPDAPPDLESILVSLREAAEDLKHPFRTPSLATAQANRPSARKVVLREVDSLRGILAFFSDRRAGKIADLISSPFAECVFYDPASQIQIRAAGHAAIHIGDETAQNAWQNTPPANRLNYCAIKPPGATMSPGESLFPPDWNDDSPTLGQTEIGFKNFAVIAVEFDRIEWLRLHPKGHHRLLFLRKDTGEWSQQPIVP